MNSNTRHLGKRKALIVAISEYDQLGNLDFCKSDGHAVHNILLAHNYDIPEQLRLIGRVDGYLLREKIIDFFTDSSVTLEDTLLFYYSGHGIPDSGGQVYLCASEINVDRPYRCGFSFQDLTDMMNRSISKKIIAILDCCYSGTAEISKGGEHDAAKLGNAAIVRGMNTLTEGEGRCILASSQANQEAYALMEENHSVFTHFLIKGLSGDKQAMDKYGYVTADSLAKFIYDGIMSLPVDKRPKQKPVRKMDISGEIVIAHYPRANTNDKLGKLFNYSDNYGRRWTAYSLEVMGSRKGLNYAVKTPSGKVVIPRKGHHWRFSEDRLQQLIREDRIWFGQHGDRIPTLKRYFDEIHHK